MAGRSILLGLTHISYVQAVVCCLGFALDRKIQTGRRKGTRSQEARQMTLSVSWTTRLDFKTFLTACRNAWDGGGEFNTEN